MAQGRAFEFQAQEQRDVSKLNRLYGQADQARGAAAQSRASETSAIMGGINALGGAVSSGAFGGTPLSNNKNNNGGVTNNYYYTE
jgi:uncharacterized protein YidB (DUF937 family)